MQRTAVEEENLGFEVLDQQKEPSVKRPVGAPRAGRPLRYYPDDLLFTMRYCLERDATFERKLEENTLLTADQYKRRDALRINYFRAVKDSPNDDSTLVTVDALLDYYMSLKISNNEKEDNKENNDNKITHEDITLLPICLVKGDRNHYNTLMLRFDEDNNLYVTIIEPKDNKLFPYPIQDVFNDIAKIWKKSANYPNAKVYSHLITTGHQEFTDLNSCGAQHLRYAECILQMKADDIRNPRRLEHALSLTDLRDRGADYKKIDQTKAGLHKKDLFPKVEDKFSTAVAIMKKYNIKHHTAGFFHSRQSTAKVLTSVLDGLSKDEVGLHQAAVVLLMAYQSIDTISSVLRDDHIGQALSVLLDCQDEYILQQAVALPSKENIALLFKKRLAVLQMSLSQVVLEASKQQALYKCFMTLDNNAVSLWRKIKGTTAEGEEQAKEVIRRNIR